MTALCRACQRRARRAKRQGMGWGSLLAESLRPVVDLVYPPRCPLCGDAVAEQGGLCSDCFGELDMPAGPSSIETGCAAGQAGPVRVFAATFYNDASRKLVLTFKHGGKIALAKLLGRLMAARLPPVGEERPPLLVPVPLHRWRLWGRGYNQAALLAREIERHGKGDLMVDGLIRRKPTPSLGGLGQEQRRRVLSGAIAVRRSRAAQISGRDVILVDDVLTSGATSDACVAALVDAAGARSVQIVCFARVESGHKSDSQ